MSLKEWFGKGPKGDWVDIGAPKKGGKFQKCGRAKTNVATKAKKSKETGNPAQDKFLASHMRKEYKDKPNMSKDEHDRQLAIGFKKFENRKKK